MKNNINTNVHGTQYFKTLLWAHRGPYSDRIYSTLDPTPSSLDSLALP